MASRPIFEPKAPSRQMILDTVGDQGESHFRNPVHLPPVTGRWPKSANEGEEGRERRKINEVEKKLHRNGSLG
jgi:hypothetical protein